MRTAPRRRDAVATHGPGYQACTLSRRPRTSLLDVPLAAGRAWVPGFRASARSPGGRPPIPRTSGTRHCSTPVTPSWEAPELASRFGDHRPLVHPGTAVVVFWGFASARLTRGKNI